MIIRYDFTGLTNPFGFHDNVKRAMSDALEKAECYPDEEYGLLQQKLSNDFGIDESNIIITAGAAQGIFLVPQVVKPSQAGIIQPTFNYYRPALLAVGSNIIDITLNEDFTLPLTKIMSLLSGIDLLFICNPNHPTSKTYPVGQIVEIIEKAAVEGCLVVVDEVYMDFANNSKEKSIKNLISQYSNLAVIRSFSKTLAIPGLRIGYVLAGFDIAQQLKEILHPWPVNIIALKTVREALRERQFLIETLRKTRLARDIFAGELRSLNIFEVFESDCNFIMVKTLVKGKGKLIKERLEERGILVHCLGDHVGLDDDYIQIGVRRSADNGVLIDALKLISDEERLVA